MDLDTATIREAGLGPIVLFYTKTKRVSPAISRQADALVQAWSRPIIKRPADYRSKHIASADQLEIQGGEEIEDETLYEDETQAPRARPAKAGKPRRFDVRKALEENEGRKGARPLIANVSWSWRSDELDVVLTVSPCSTLLHPSHARSISRRILRTSRASRWTTASSTVLLVSSRLAVRGVRRGVGRRGAEAKQGSGSQRRQPTSCGIRRRGAKARRRWRMCCTICIDCSDYMT